MKKVDKENFDELFKWIIWKSSASFLIRKIEWVKQVESYTPFVRYSYWLFYHYNDYDMRSFDIEKNDDRDVISFPRMKDITFENFFRDFGGKMLLVNPLGYKCVRIKLPTDIIQFEVEKTLMENSNG